MTPKDIADGIDAELTSDLFHETGMVRLKPGLENFHRACHEAAVIMRQLEAPDEWLAVVTDEDGNRIDSETFGGDYSIEVIREKAAQHFGDLPAGHNLRFYPIGPERVDLAIGFAGNIPDPRLTHSIALLRIRNGISAQIDKAIADKDFALEMALHELHQENEVRIDADQTKYLTDRGWADDDGWDACPDAYMGETLWSGHATEGELRKWFG